MEGAAAFTQGWIDGWNWWVNEGVVQAEVWSERRLKELHLACADKRLGAAGHAQFAKDTVDMRFDRTDGYHHACCNFAIRSTLSDQV